MSSKLVDHIANGEPAQNTIIGNQFEKAIVDFYQCKQTLDFFNSCTNDSLSPTMVITATLPHPVQSVTQKYSGRCFPICTSFEEPELDRTFSKVLLWHAGTLTGEMELNSLESYFVERGVEVEKHINRNMSLNTFLDLYQDTSFDAVWISAHGEFVHNDPHLSKLYLSDDGSNYATLSDLMDHPFKGKHRRLLILNFCFGGASQVCLAPPKFGISPMLAASNQAVISHLWPVSMLAAPVFSALLAIGITKYVNFFDSFSFALEMLRMPKNELIQLLLNEGDSFIDVSTRVDRSSMDFDSISVWGSPVYYE